MKIDDFLKLDDPSLLYESLFLDFVKKTHDPLAFLSPDWKTILLKIIQQKGARVPDQPLFREIRHAHLVYIDPSAVLEPFVMIQGPTYIGPHAIIRQGAYIRSNSFVGPHVIVGHGTELKGSVLMQGVKAAHFAYIGDSVVGEETNLGAGVKCANVRLDRQEIVLRGDGERRPTHFKKLGALIGHHTQVGCNAVINPGRYLPPFSVVPPLKNI